MIASPVPRAPSEGGTLEVAGRQNEREDRVVELESGKEYREREQRYLQFQRRSSEITDQLLDADRQEDATDDQDEHRTEQPLRLDESLDRPLEAAFVLRRVAVFTRTSVVALGENRRDRNCDERRGHQESGDDPSDRSTRGAASRTDRAHRIRDSRSLRRDGALDEDLEHVGSACEPVPYSQQAGGISSMEISTRNPWEISTRASWTPLSLHHYHCPTRARTRGESHDGSDSDSLSSSSGSACRTNARSGGGAMRNSMRRASS